MTEDNVEYVLVTEYFRPDTASTGQYMTELAVGLNQRGLDMSVYTSQPNYHSGDYQKQPRQSVYNGVPVTRIRAPQLRQSSLARRLFNWSVFTVWMFFVLLLSQSEKKRELIFVSNPPFLPVAMWLVCRLRGWDYTYIVYDLYPDQPVELGYIKEDGLIERVWMALNGRAFLGAENIVALGPVMKDRICRNGGAELDGEKVRIIHNWADGEFIKPREKSDNWFSEEHGLVDKFTAVYSGNIGEFHDLETVVKAARELDETRTRILIIGNGDAKRRIVDLSEELGVRGSIVRFLPYQPKENLPYSLTAGDVSIVTVKDGFEGVCVSSKMYTAMAAGQPLLVISHPDDDEARMVSRFDAGFNVPQGDVTGVVEAIEAWRQAPALLEQQGHNARKAFEDNFIKSESLDEYARMLTEKGGQVPEPAGSSSSYRRATG